METKLRRQDRVAQNLLGIDVEVHFGIAEIAVIQSHRVDMNLCLHQRLTEYTGDIRYAGQQAIEHDGLHR